MKRPRSSVLIDCCPGGAAMPRYVVCHNCRTTRSVEEHFQDAVLQVRGLRNMQASLLNFVAPTHLRGMRCVELYAVWQAAH